jgi:chromosome segregation ATPase
MTSSSSLEARVAHVEGIVGQLDARLARLEARLDEAVGQLRSEITRLREEVRGEIGQLRDEINDVRREIRTNFYGIIGMLIGMWVTIILAIFFQ